MQTQSLLQQISVPLPSKLDVPGAELLSANVEFMRYCAICDSEQIFVADRILGVQGFIGACSRCGDERFVPFTRTTIEVCA